MLPMGEFASSYLSIFFLIPVEFDNYMQQDAHEFLNFLINHINEIILGECKLNPEKEIILSRSWVSLFDTVWHCFVLLKITSCSFFTPLAERPQNTNSRHKSGNGDSISSQSEPTWVHEIFQGILTSETRCLNCEAVSTPKNIVCKLK